MFVSKRCAMSYKFITKTCIKFKKFVTKMCEITKKFVTKTCFYFCSSLKMKSLYRMIKR